MWRDSYEKRDLFIILLFARFNRMFSVHEFRGRRAENCFRDQQPASSAIRCARYARHAYGDSSLGFLDRAGRVDERDSCRRLVANDRGSKRIDRGVAWFGF